MLHKAITSKVILPVQQNINTWFLSLVPSRITRAIHQALEWGRNQRQELWGDVSSSLFNNQAIAWQSATEKCHIAQKYRDRFSMQIGQHWHKTLLTLMQEYWA